MHFFFITTKLNTNILITFYFYFLFAFSNWLQDIFFFFNNEYPLKTNNNIARSRNIKKNVKRKTLSLEVMINKFFRAIFCCCYLCHLHVAIKLKFFLRFLFLWIDYIVLFVFFFFFNERKFSTKNLHLFPQALLANIFSQLLIKIITFVVFDQVLNFV